MPLIPFDTRPLPEPPQFHAPEDAPAQGPLALDLAGNARAEDLLALLPRAALIRVGFPSFADGRGFSLGRRLRDLSYRGRLRAHGAVIPDQRLHLRACGFDEVEIGADLLARQGGVAAWAQDNATPPFRLRRQVVQANREDRASAA